MSRTEPVRIWWFSQNIYLLSSKSSAHLKMRLIKLVVAAVSADLCSDGSQCKADDQCKLNNRDPCFGGHCWENFVSIY